MSPPNFWTFRRPCSMHIIVSQHAKSHDLTFKREWHSIIVAHAIPKILCKYSFIRPPKHSVVTIFLEYFNKFWNILAYLYFSMWYLPAQYCNNTWLLEIRDSAFWVVCFINAIKKIIQFRYYEGGFFMFLWAKQKQN